VDTPRSAMIDVAFPLHGRELPRDHRLVLAQALGNALPWLGTDPQAAVHPIRVVSGNGEQALLSARARLVLRVRRERVGALAALAEHTLQLEGGDLCLGAPQQRELLPHATLYAHFVDADDADEAAFLEAVGTELQRLEIACHRVCGREQRVRGPSRALRGFSLMLHGLRAIDSLRVLERGLGAHRLMGCGVFVPHKSAAAVGD
jgi:CRISPR-associated protein Cas6